MVQFFLCHRWIGWVYHYYFVVYSLNNPGCCIFIAFFFNVPEIGGLLLFVSEAFFVGMEGNILLIRLAFIGQISNLRNSSQ